MGVSLYTLRDRGAEKDYPSWVDGAPNLQTYLTALNKSQPIIQCQYEIVWSRWPRTLFFSKNITIPGVSVNTLDLSHAGFTIKIPTHVTYETTDISFNIIADKEGFHYYDLRNMVLQTGHPLVAGDPKSTIGNPYGISTDEDTIEVRLRNRPSDGTHHHWIFHNFKPTGIGDVELSQDSGSFVEFELKGTFTHISYDCGKVLPPEEPPSPSEDEVPHEENPPEEDENEEEPDYPYDPEEEYMDFREEEPPEPEPEPEPKPPSYTSLVSATDSLESNENGESFVSSATEASFLEPVDDEYVEGAKECVDELDQAAEDFKKEIEAIKNMPADPNFTPETEMSSEETFNSVDVPREGQGDPDSEDYKGDSIKAGVSCEVTVKSQAQKDAYDAAVAKYNEKAQASMNKYKESRQQGSSPKGTRSSTSTNEDDMKKLFELPKAIRFNHNLSTTGGLKAIANLDKEIDSYEVGTTQLTLPHRFGMYKTPTKDVPKRTEVELEDPPFNVSEALSILERNPNHKVRGIFD